MNSTFIPGIPYIVTFVARNMRATNARIAKKRVKYQFYDKIKVSDVYEVSPKRYNVHCAVEFTPDSSDYTTVLVRSLR